MAPPAVGRAMLPRNVFYAAAASIVALVAAVAIAQGTEDEVRPASADDAAAAVPGGGPVNEVVWDGWIRDGRLDRFAHTYETELLLDGHVRMGFNLHVPEATEGIAFVLAWEGGFPMSLMVHAPLKDGVMPTFHSEREDTGSVCLRVPPEDLAAGEWKVMAHTSEPSEVAFTVTVLHEGPTPPRVDEELHGHRTADGMAMEHADGLPCEDAAA